MRDEQTGSYWQQISGMAISGPMKGTQLKLVPSDELNFATWKSEQPEGTVLNDVAQYASEYAAPDWDKQMRRAPVVIDFPEHNLKPRDLMLGIQAFGASRAWPYRTSPKRKARQGLRGNLACLIGNQVPITNPFAPSAIRITPTSTELTRPPPGCDALPPAATGIFRAAPSQAKRKAPVSSKYLCSRTIGSTGATIIPKQRSTSFAKVTTCSAETRTLCIR